MVTVPRSVWLTAAVPVGLLVLTLVAVALAGPLPLGPTGWRSVTTGALPALSALPVALLAVRDHPGETASLHVVRWAGALLAPASVGVLLLFLALLRPDFDEWSGVGDTALGGIAGLLALFAVAVLALFPAAAVHYAGAVRGPVWRRWALGALMAGVAVATASTLLATRGDVDGRGAGALVGVLLGRGVVEPGWLVPGWAGALTALAALPVLLDTRRRQGRIGS